MTTESSENLQAPQPHSTATSTTRADWPEVAVVMPVRNESRFIEDTLTQILEQEYPAARIQVVVADGHSTDGTVDIVNCFKDRLPQLKVVTNDVGGPGAGRNLGIRNTTAPYIIVIDGHVHIPSKTLLRDMVETFERTRAYCLCRPQPLNPPGINLFQEAVALARGSALGHNPDSDIYSDLEKETDPTSSGAMWRREVFERLGYFDEEFDACEDVDLNYRVKVSGMKAWLSPKLRVFYYPRDSVGALWRQMFRYGVGRFRFSRKHKRLTLTQMLAPIGVVGFVVFGLASLLGAEGSQEFTASMVTLYLLLILGASGLISLQKRQFAYIFSLPVIFPVIHFGLGTGFLVELFKDIRHRRKSGKPLNPFKEEGVTTEAAPEPRAKSETETPKHPEAPPKSENQQTAPQPAPPHPQPPDTPAPPAYPKLPKPPATDGAE
jgi:succinoglycan biosynthesis protein ExoA